MNAPLRSVFFAVLLGLGACGDAAPPPPHEPEPVAESHDKKRRREPDATEPAAQEAAAGERHDERLIPGDLNGWVPDDGLIAKAQGLSDPEAYEKLGELPLAERVALIRTALRLDDEDLARAIAFRADWEHLDLWEARRAVDLMVDAVFDSEWRDPEGGGGEGYGLSGVYEIAGRDDLTRILERLIEVPADHEGFYDLDSLHKLVHAGHAPLVARACLAPHPRIRDFARDLLLSQLVARTDHYKDHFAAAILGLTVEEARRRYPALPDGIDPLLEAVLRRQHLVGEDKLRERYPERSWAWRWLAGSAPVERDLPFLLELGRAVPDGVAGLDVVSWLLRGFDDAESAALLAERAAEQGSTTALGALTVRGDEAAERRLTERAAAKSGALNVLLAAKPAVGRELVAAALFGEDATARGEMLKLVEEAWIEGPADTGVWFDPGTVAELEARAFASGLGTDDLAKIAVAIPGARTKRLARAAIARWDQAALSSLVVEPLRLHSRPLTFLETAAREAFHAQVAAFARDPGRAQAFGWEALMRVGARDAGEEQLLVASMPAPQAPSRGYYLQLLERSPGRVVREFLRDHLSEAMAPTEEAVAAAQAYLAVTGLPPGMRLEVIPDVWPAFRDFLLADRPGDALAHVLEAMPDQQVENIHRFVDPRAKAYLERLRERRELGLYAWATAELELMCGGLHRETPAALHGHRYRWVDDLSSAALLEGRDPAALPALFDHLESNCCSQIAIVGLCEELLGFEFPRGNDGIGETRAHLMRRLWNAAEGNYVWSVLAQRYVPAAR